MTTDITELAQSLKAAADREMICRDVAETSEIWERTVTPENILALVEALEKAQQVDEELCKLLPPGAEYMDPPDGGDVTPLEGVRRMVADYRQRIAELESRTVKMPHRNLGHPKLFLLCPFPYYDAEDMEKALAAAGIRVEAG
ncbi:hypothetical protein ACSJHJ_17060 [Klebsiella pneumoniae]|uniref:hypothetical protein n=1 Tax=Klebsiella pneumoniae TaxID=573 RepID=UPI0039BAE74F|nr:hypothetical protein [Klebsiella pneumoniae]HBT0156136.1 hypothetical protein [Klebsiella pneumoniae]HBT0215349.1 hypothetical protein [Klebsiella pneumoniae]